MAQDDRNHPTHMLDAMVEYVHAVEGPACDFSYEEARWVNGPLLEMLCCYNAEI